MDTAMIREQLGKDVNGICFAGGRRAGSEGSGKAREYLLGRMRELGLVPYGGHMDLVGHDVPAPGGLHREIAETIRRLLFMTGAESAPGLADIVGKTRIPEGLGVIAALNSYVGDMSDHHIFRVNRVPYLFLSCGHWPHYHMKTDTVEKLNFSKISLICEYLVALSSELAGKDVQKSGDDADTIKFEIGTVEKALGKNYKSLLEAIGVGLLKGRKDMDRFADVLRGFGI